MSRRDLFARCDRSTEAIPAVFIIIVLSRSSGWALEECLLHRLISFGCAGSFMVRVHSCPRTVRSDDRMVGSGICRYKLDSSAGKAQACVSINKEHTLTKKNEYTLARPCAFACAYTVAEWRPSHAPHLG